MPAFDMETKFVKIKDSKQSEELANERNTKIY